LTDFIARLGNGLHLIVEIKGRRTAADIKEAAVRRWANAVNRDGGHGKCAYTLVYEPPELVKALDMFCASMQESVECAK